MEKIEQFYMRCQKCGVDFKECEIDVSHDVPKYIFKNKNEADKFGRHNLCKKCHDIYEKSVFAWMVNPLPDELKRAMIQSAQRFSKFYFPKKEEIQNVQSN